MRSAMAGKGQQQDVGIGLPTEVHDQPPPAPRETASRPSAVEPNTTMSLSPWRLEEGPQAPKDKAPYPHTPHNSEVKALDPTKRGNIIHFEHNLTFSLGLFKKPRTNGDLGIYVELWSLLPVFIAWSMAISGKAIYGT